MENTSMGRIVICVGRHFDTATSWQEEAAIQEMGIGRKAIVLDWVDKEDLRKALVGVPLYRSRITATDPEGILLQIFARSLFHYQFGGTGFARTRRILTQWLQEG